MSNAIYDKIGEGYNETRTADPYLTGRIIANLQPVHNGRYLDVGCGTGNYLKALTDRGYTIDGIDPSDRMLEVARAKCIGAHIVKGYAEDMPFDSETYDGAMGNFTLHHWQSIGKGLKEIHRVLKAGARVVFLSFTPHQIYGYWLCRYFPDMMKRSAELIPDLETMTALLLEAGFKNIHTEKYFVQDDLQDQFLYAAKHKPERYLDANYRKGASSFSAFCEAEELQKGLQQLDADIESGAIHDIIHQYENDLGDYLFIIAEK